MATFTFTTAPPLIQAQELTAERQKFRSSCVLLLPLARITRKRVSMRMIELAPLAYTLVGLLLVGELHGCMEMYCAMRTLLSEWFGACRVPAES